VNFLSRPLGECGSGRFGGGSNRYASVPTVDIEMEGLLPTSAVPASSGTGAGIPVSSSNSGTGTGSTKTTRRQADEVAAVRGATAGGFLDADDDDFNNGKVKPDEARMMMAAASNGLGGAGALTGISVGGSGSGSGGGSSSGGGGGGAGGGVGGGGLDGASGILHRSGRHLRHVRTLRMRFWSLRCPRWLAVALSLMWVGGVFAGLVILVVDAVQSFEHQNLAQYETRLRELLASMLMWLKHNFNVDGSYLTDQLTEEFDFVNLTSEWIRE
jgi:hypothetical protein